MASRYKPRVRFPSQKDLQAALDYNPTSGVFRWKAAASSRWRGVIGGIAGSKDANGYIQIKLCGTTYKAHHLAWIYVHGEMHSMPPITQSQIYGRALMPRIRRTNEQGTRPDCQRESAEVCEVNRSQPGYALKNDCFT